MVACTYVGKVVEELEASINSGNGLEGGGDNVLDCDFNITHTLTELGVVVVPLGALYIQDSVLNGSHANEMFLKRNFDSLKCAGDIWAYMIQLGGVSGQVKVMADL
jgi:hypothetical protein